MAGTYPNHPGSEAMFHSGKTPESGQRNEGRGQHRRAGRSSDPKRRTRRGVERTSFDDEAKENESGRLGQPRARYEEPGGRGRLTSTRPSTWGTVSTKTLRRDPAHTCNHSSVHSGPSSFQSRADCEENRRIKVSEAFCSKRGRGFETNRCFSHSLSPSAEADRNEEYQLHVEGWADVQVQNEGRLDSLSHDHSPSSFPSK